MDAVEEGDDGTDVHAVILREDFGQSGFEFNDIGNYSGKGFGIDCLQHFVHGVSFVEHSHDVPPGAIGRGTFGTRWAEGSVRKK